MISRLKKWIHSSHLFWQPQSDIISSADKGPIFYGMFIHCHLQNVQSVNYYCILHNKKTMWSQRFHSYVSIFPHNFPASKGVWASGRVFSTALHTCDEILPYFFLLLTLPFPQWISSHYNPFSTSAITFIRWFVNTVACLYKRNRCKVPDTNLINENKV